MGRLGANPRGGRPITYSKFHFMQTHSANIRTSSQKMDWATPQEWFDYMDLEFDFTLDPCADSHNAKCRKFFTAEHDGLSKSWADERVFMNPPYGRALAEWMRKAYEEARDYGALVVCLVPARVDTNWWHNYAAKGEIRFPRGRLKFGNGNSPAPFPIAVVIFRPFLKSAARRRAA
jgi:site-specific DNA-methyltransferase (adenine-specific)